MEFGSVDEIMDFAIKSEEQAAKFYSDLAATVEDANIRRMFEGFAIEEQGHAMKLAEIRDGKLLASATEKVLDLKIADITEEIEPHSEMTLQEALTVAMQREKRAFQLYSGLASAADDDGLRSAFEMLAQQEAKHKLRFEIEYDEMILSEN